LPSGKRGKKKKKEKGKVFQKTAGSWEKKKKKKKRWKPVLQKISLFLSSPFSDTKGEKRKKKGLGKRLF